MGGYYAEKLGGQRLRRCYALAPPRVRRYLEAEITHVQNRIRPSDAVLELGCGYGRVALRLAEVAHQVVGIDTSDESLALARRITPDGARCRFERMDATDLQFEEGRFDVVVCVQNGICAFGADPLDLIREAVRVTRPGGRALFSTYADAFWEHRLEWFQAQARAGLLGEIDTAATGDGVIVCRDGFRAGRLRPDELVGLCGRLGLHGDIVEVDGSSVFCEIVKGGIP